MSAAFTSLEYSIIGSEHTVTTKLPHEHYVTPDYNPVPLFMQHLERNKRIQERLANSLPFGRCKRCSIMPWIPSPLPLELFCHQCGLMLYSLK
jgi:hypothetical protein